MRSAGNRGVVHDRLQVLHVHVFLAAPLGARHMADQFIEVADEVAEALDASRRQEAAYVERARYNKAYYSLDCDDGTNIPPA